MGRYKIDQKYILITSMNFPSGGAGATYLNLFCRGLRLNGCDISVLLLKGFAFGNYTYKGSRKNITEEGIPYTYLGFKQRPENQIIKLFDECLSIFRLILFLATLVNKRKSTTLLVYNSEIQYNIPIFAITKLFGIKISKFCAEIIDRSEFHGSFMRRLKRYSHFINYRYLNKLSDKLILFSFYLKEEYLKMGYPEKDIFVQPNLTDFDFWKPSDKIINYTLGYSGAPYLKDGLSDLFKAIEILRNEGIDLTLLVIGDATFGQSLIPMLKSVTSKLGISDKVTYTGLVESSRVKEYLAECKILAITRPSTTQTKSGFPTKLGEYFATKRPVLATNFGDMERYFTDGQDIVLAECGNPESIAEKIAWMLKNNGELEEISKKGYERADQLLEYRKSVNRMISFLTTV
jgi:glycosyltransferase involved in cell wall biosynthesis